MTRTQPHPATRTVGAAGRQHDGSGDVLDAAVFRAPLRRTFRLDKNVAPMLRGVRVRGQGANQPSRCEAKSWPTDRSHARDRLIVDLATSCTIDMWKMTRGVTACVPD